MKKQWYRLVISFLFCLILAGCNVTSEDADLPDLEQSNQVNSYGASETKTDDSKDEDILEVHYIDIGQGDSILIQQGNAAMLIDAGNNSKGTTVWSYLLNQNVDSLDYAVGTHPDADHIGGLDVVLYKLDCNTIFLPDCESDTRTYEELLDVIETKDQHAVVPKQGETYSLGEAEFQILTDTDKDYGGNKNDYSLALRLTFGDTSFLFTGDAEEKAENDMLASGLMLASDVYKAGHHGADTANTEDFLRAVNPKYCVISCGQDNTYGHPRAGFLNNLRSLGVSVFRTDEQGSIVAVSDGETITFNCSPSETWKAGEPTGNGDSDREEDVYETSDKNGGSGTGTESNNMSEEKGFILNTKTKKFHRENCNSVQTMADKNKQVSDKTREELIDEGYEPCKNCNP